MSKQILLEKEDNREWISTMDYRIVTDGNLTSYVFYNEVIAQLHNYFSKGIQSRIVFDFSQVKSIDALVLPNLLCTGYWIEQHRGTPARIFIPGNLASVPLRTFLERTKFVELAKTYGLFEFDEDISGGLKDTVSRPTLNKLALFQIAYKDSSTSEQSDIDVAKTKEVAWEQLKKTFVPFISTFLQKSTDPYVQTHRKEISSDLLSFCKELIENALLHGRSFCFFNMQYSSTFRKQIKLSISDCGMGFKRSINEDYSRSQHILSLQQLVDSVGAERAQMEDEIHQLLSQCYPLQQDDVDRLAGYPHMSTELEGIIYGLLSRRFKPYGLYNIHQKIIHRMGGTIRIHSNDTQVILSQRMWAPLAVCDAPEDLVKLLCANNQYTANVRTGLTFKGTHIEIEFMLGEDGEDGK